MRTTNNAFDYHGLGLLSKYRTHAHVAAETYLYVHGASRYINLSHAHWLRTSLLGRPEHPLLLPSCADTVTFAADFVERFEAFRLPRSRTLFTTWPLPNSNIVAFGSLLLREMASNFDGNLSKQQAFFCEFG
jgi:hypothetical protein